MLLTADSEFATPRRGWATLTSFTLQTAALAVILAVPVLRPSLLPPLNATPSVVPMVRLGDFAPIHTHTSPGNSEAVHASVFRAPSVIPPTTSGSADPTASEPEAPPCVSCVPGVGNTGPIIPGALATFAVAVLPPAPPVQRTVRISVMMDGLLIHRVQPEYPPLARQARIQGTVSLAAVISKEGAIENLRVLSGHPMLVSAAINAVKQWRYRPYVLNGNPIEVDTQITVNFSLAGN